MAQRNKKLQLKFILARTQFSSFVQCGARCINYFRSGSQRREIFWTKKMQQQRTPTRTITILRQNKRIIQPRWAQRFNVGYAFTLCAVALQTLFSPHICLLSHRIWLDAHVPAEQKENIKHSRHSTRWYQNGQFDLLFVRSFSKPHFHANGSQTISVQIFRRIE